MENTDDVRWALIDLIRVLDTIYGADPRWRLSYPGIHTELARIARTLDVELPAPALPTGKYGEGNGKLAADDT